MAGIVVTRRPKRRGFSGLFGTLFFGAFLTAGLFFAYMLGSETLERADTWRWVETPCRVQSIQIVDGFVNDEADPYAIDVTYDYEFEFSTYRSEQWTIGDGRTANYGKLHEVVRESPPGSTTSCYVNPRDPHAAVLQRASLWIALFLPLPLVFILVGGAGVWGSWSSASSKAGEDAPRPISRRKPKVWKWILPLLVVGLAVLSLYAGGRLYEQFTVGQRETVEGKVLHSRLLWQESSEGGTTYALDILYEFELDGVTYRSNRYDTLTYIFSSGKKGKHEILARYPRGSHVICYVDPTRPESAMLSPSFRPLHLILLIPFAALVVIGLIARRVRAKSIKRDSAAKRAPAAPGPAVLAPQHSKGAKLFGLASFSAIWFAICVFLVNQSLRPSSGWVLWFITGMFCLFSVFLVAGLLQSLLSMFSPRIHLELSTDPLKRGEHASIRWTVPRGAEKFERITVKLEGREEAVYRRGTDTITDKHVFTEIPVAEVMHAAEMRAGEAGFQLPADAMHTFRSTHNRIVWEIKVHGEIAKWPDVQEVYPVRVFPAYEAD